MKAPPASSKAPPPPPAKTVKKEAPPKAAPPKVPIPDPKLFFPAPVKKATTPAGSAPKQVSTAPKQPLAAPATKAATEKGKGSARSIRDEDEPSAVYLRPGSWKPHPDKPDDGKIIIPKILLDGYSRKKDPDMGRSSVDHRYEVFGGTPEEDLSIRAKDAKRDKDKKDSKDRANDKDRPKSKGRPADKDKRGGFFMGRGRRKGKESPGSVAAMRGSAPGDKKRRRKFIKALFQEDEYDDPPCCPRMGLLTAMWILVGAAVTLVYMFLFGVRSAVFPEPSMIQLDNDSYFFMVNLVIN